jgi:amidase
VTDELGATAGSFALVGAKPARENAAVTRLRDAGVVILGAANMSEWANFRTLDNEDNGWSARGGQGYGAYYDKMDPSGSSSGSAVAVDLGMCALALGTEVRCSNSSQETSLTLCRRVEASFVQPAREMWWASSLLSG